MEALADIFSWRTATEPSLKDQIYDAFKKTDCAEPGFILSIDPLKVAQGEREVLGEDYMAVSEKSKKFMNYGHNRKEIYRKGKVLSVLGYNAMDFLYFISRNDQLIPALKIEYTAYETISTPLKIIEHIQLVCRKELLKRSHYVRYMKARLEELGLLVAPIGKRRD